MAKKRLGKIARYKIQRRLGSELPGLGKPGALERRPYPPGENGNKRKKYSDFALRLEEKQKLRALRSSRRTTSSFHPQLETRFGS